MSERILFVDDDVNALSAYRRRLRKQFNVETAPGPEEGLEAIAGNGPYAVVVSDLRMPGMDGIEFLALVRDRSPDTVRIMLTGHADVATTMAAVNKGSIFRFLTKPVDPDELVHALEGSLVQHRLITAERELLEETLDGSIRLLTEVVSLVNPVAFSRAARLRRYVQHMAAQLELPSAWRFRLAATLSQIGCITLPPDILEKTAGGQPLSYDEQKMVAAHPAIGSRLVVNIPRLEPVARMIERQDEPFFQTSSEQEPRDRNVADVGAQMLKVALELDRLVTRGVPFREAIAQLRERPEECDPVIVGALDSLGAERSDMEAKTVRLDDLNTRMVMGQDVRVKNGPLVVAMGQEVTLPVLERLRRLGQLGAIEEPMRVFVPRPRTAPTAATASSSRRTTAASSEPRAASQKRTPVA